ncbi:hypothetical protein [Bacillus sp. MMSF_3328]|uniref:hypothetical protein n=1 Tax=Bacillus sp. MMSF_3328 TaxID=3047080 RepID=UPI00273D0846|nr:hypothetical protein [Bacillus sp. MMSF_3328]
METKLKSLDLDSQIGSVTLSDGQSLDIPKLSMLKIIKIVKFLGIDGSKLYSQCREILIDENLEDLEKFAVVLETLDEKQLVKIFAITLDMSEEEVLALDQNEMLEVLLVYVEKTNLKKTYSLIRQLMAKMFNKEMPESLGDWLKQRQENRMKLMEMRQQALAAAQADGKNS